MIKRIELVNFMSHEHTVIEPSDGLTVLIGPNNCGKSAIVNALQVLCNNSKSTYVLRHGSKECQIIVETDSGDSICWSRKKSGSPKYVINGQTFDRLKGKVPDEVHQILRMPTVDADKESYDVHFGEQRSPIFLLGDKEKAAAQFFASSSDASRMVEMQSLHKNKVRRNTIDLDRLKKEKVALQKELDALLPIEKLREKADKCQTAYEELQTQTATQKTLSAAMGKLSAVGNRANFLTAVSAILAAVPKPIEIAPTAELRRLSQQLESAAAAKLQLEQSCDALESLEQPPQLGDTRSLQALIAQLEDSTKLQQRLERDAKTLGALGSPPELSPVKELGQQIDAIELAQLKGRALAAQNEWLSKVQPPEAPVSTVAIRQTIAAVEDAFSRHEQVGQLLSQTEKDLTEAETEFENWIVQHPQCPTCGGALSIDTLPCGAGGDGQHATTPPLEVGIDE